MAGRKRAHNLKRATQLRPLPGKSGRPGLTHTVILFLA